MIYNVKCEKIKYQLKSGINTVKHTHKAIITVITVSEYEIEMSWVRHKPEDDDGDGEGELVSTNIINHQ